MKVKKVKYNWHQIGSVTDNAGSGEDYDVFEVGQKGVIEIQEWLPGGDIPMCYTAIFEDKVIRIFNPNTVEYEK